MKKKDGKIMHDKNLFDGFEVKFVCPAYYSAIHIRNLLLYKYFTIKYLIKISVPRVSLGLRGLQY